LGILEILIGRGFERGNLYLTFPKGKGFERENPYLFLNVF